MSRRGLSLAEQETIILFNEAEATASVYTHNASLQRVLLELCQTHPAQSSAAVFAQVCQALWLLEQ